MKANFLTKSRKYIQSLKLLYLSPDASRAEKRAFIYAWPYEPARQHRRYKDLNKIRQFILDYFGLVLSSANTNPGGLDALLDELRETYLIESLSELPTNRPHYGDSGLHLLCYPDGISIIYPSFWLLPKKLQNQPKRIVFLSHMLPAGQTSVATLIRRIFNRRYTLILSILAITFVSVFLSLIPTWIIDYIFNSVVPQGQVYLMIQIGFFLLMTKLISHSFGLINQFIGIRLEMILGYVTTTTIFNRILNMPNSFFNRYPTGDLQQRVGSIHALRRTLQSSFVSAITASFVITMNLTMIYLKSFSISLLLVLVMLTLLGPIIDLASAIVETVFRYKKLVLGASLNEAILNPLESIITVRSLNAEEDVFRNFASVRERIARLEIKLTMIRIIISGIDVTISSFVIALFIFAFSSDFLLHILMPSSSQAGASAVSQGYVILLLSSFTTINGGVRSFSKSFLSLAKIYPDFLRIRPILREATKPSVNQYSNYHSIHTMTLRFDARGGSYLNQPELTFQSEEPILITAANKKHISYFLSFMAGENDYAELFKAATIVINNTTVMSSQMPEYVERQSALLVGNSFITSSSILDAITDHSHSVDDSYMSECLQAVGLESSDTLLNTDIIEYLKRSPTKLQVGKRLMICRAFYLRLSPIIIDGWLDLFDPEVASSMLSHCKLNRIILIANSHQPSACSLFKVTANLDNYFLSLGELKAI